jgi:3-phenylpropionate/trans-cinnamate dioxygenase ferredoxin subunit
MNEMSRLIEVCKVDDVEVEGVRRFDHEQETYAIIRGPDGDYYATQGFCSHEKAHLTDGIIDEYDIECPRHFGAFDYRSGKPTVPPACKALRTYKVVVQGGSVFLEL